MDMQYSSLDTSFVYFFVAWWGMYCQQDFDLRPYKVSSFIHIGHFPFQDQSMTMTHYSYV